MMRAARGAKGGGNTPYEASDSLRSTQRAEIVDLLGEGQIRGLVNGLKSVYLDGVPVENADGTRNFGEFGLHLSTGGPTKLAGDLKHVFADVQTEVPVGVNVLHAVPVVRTISDATVHSVRVTIAVPALVEAKDSGDRVGASFEWAIDVQSNGGGWVERYHDTLEGKASSTYMRAVRVDLRAAGPAPWDIRVRRISTDSTSSNLVNAFQWSSYTALTGVRMMYRNRAVAGLTFDARLFSAIPVRSYDVMGIEDWSVPSNYDPIARTYDGTWSGVMKQDWTNNPAWVLYGLIQNKRYGLGNYVSVLPDKWTLYLLAQWCDHQVSDGRGGLEPRYTINAWITDKREALQLLQDIAGIFRGLMLYGASALTVSWDAPATPVAIFTPANVIGGVFNYSDGSQAAKRSSCTCWYSDLSQGGKPGSVTWEAPDLVAKYGMRRMEIKPLGVTSPSQALRMAKWALWTTEMEDQAVAFQIGEEGAALRVGEVFQVNDPSETGERLAGRIHAATATQVTLDSAVTLVAGEAYTLWVTQPDADDATRLTVVGRPVMNAPGQHTVLDVATAFPDVPVAQTMWLLEVDTVRPTLWRCIGLAEARQGDGAALAYDVAALRHEPGKWDLIEQGLALTERPTRRLATAAPAPLALMVQEVVYSVGVATRIRAVVSWQYPAAGLQYELTWRLSSGPWHTLTSTTANTVDLDDLQPGELQVKVTAANVLGHRSPAAEVTKVLDGLTDPMPDVSGLVVRQSGDSLEIGWGRPARKDWGATILRTGASWAAGTPIFEGLADRFAWVALPDGNYTVWAKHRDLAGVLASAQAVGISFTVAGGSVVVSWSDIVGRPDDDAIRNNLVDLRWWSAGGSIPWPTNDDGGSANTLVTTSSLAISGPRASDDVVMVAHETSTNGNQAGGWNGGGFASGALDPTRTYRFVIPVRRLSGDGTAWWGMSGVQNLNGAVEDYSANWPGWGLTSENPNPYFAGGFNFNGETDRWFLMVGYVFPAGSTQMSNTAAGVWDCKTGQKVASGNNWRFGAAGGAVSHRAYQFYASQGSEIAFGRPLVNLVDGSEPSLTQYFDAGAVLNEALVPAINAAATAAAAAKVSADTANLALDRIASDSVLSRGEKPRVMLDWQAIYDERPSIAAQAASLGIVTERDAYNAAVSALSAYLGSLTPDWNDLGQDTNIDGAQLRNGFAVVYSHRQTLLNRIAEVAATQASWSNVVGRPRMLRVLSVGASSSTHPLGPGLYDGETGAQLSAASRSYVMVKIRRSDSVVTFSGLYDVYGDAAAAAALAADLNAAGADTVVVVYTSDEPMGNRLAGALTAAMLRCGASQAVFGSPRFRFRSAYVLVGIGGCGEGNGFEAYQGSVDSDTDAWCDVSFQLHNGQLLVTGMGATPRSLADYGYVGDMNATNGAVFGVNVFGQAATDNIADNAVSYTVTLTDAAGFMNHPAA